MTILDKIMKPKSVAVIGASTKEHTIGSDIMKRLQEYKFNGNIYPVNPKGGIIEGLQAYTSILEVPGEVDLAIIVVNAKFVLDTIDQCHQKGIKGLCIITAGFKETGAEGAEMEKQLLAKVREYEYDMVSKQVEDLILLAQKGMVFPAVQRMKDIVPEFRSKNSIYEQLDK